MHQLLLPDYSADQLKTLVRRELDGHIRALALASAFAGARAALVGLLLRAWRSW